MARRQGGFSDLMDFAARLPWQAACVLAGVSFLTFHFIAVALPPSASDLGDLGSVVIHRGIHTFAYFLQFILPAGLLIGATASFIKQSRASSLLQTAKSEPMAISEMSWRDFERLVGEAFRHRGFKVTGFGGGRADGGVDLALMKNGERFLVQCKHWRKEQVGVTVVRELNGVMAVAGAQGGYVVTGGRFTPEAQEFAGKTKIELVDGKALRDLVGSSSSAPTAAGTGRSAVIGGGTGLPRVAAAGSRAPAAAGSDTR
jgi:restriction system protein